MGSSRKEENSKRHSKTGRAAEREAEASAEPEQLYGAGHQRGRRRHASRGPGEVTAALPSLPGRSSPSPRSSPPPRSVSPEHPPPQSSSPPRSSPPRCSSSVRSHPAKPSSPRISTPLRYAWLQSSSVGSSQAGSSPRRRHDSESEDEGTPVVDLYLDDPQSLLTALKGGKQYFAAILKKDCVHLPEGKLVTHLKGYILLRISPSASDIEEPIYALYRTKDLYLDGILSRRKLYRFKDHDKDLALPPELLVDEIVILDFESNYKSLKFKPHLGKQIKIGKDLFQKHYEVLLDLANYISTDASAVKKALLWLVVVFSEALRFPALEAWLYETLVSDKILHIPVKITALFNIWGTFSTALHEGGECFKPESIKTKVKDPDVSEQWGTYDKVCSLMGVVNRANWRKLLKTMGKKARMKTAMGADQAEDTYTKQEEKNMMYYIAQNQSA